MVAQRLAEETTVIDSLFSFCIMPVEKKVIFTLLPGVYMELLLGFFSFPITENFPKD